MTHAQLAAEIGQSRMKISRLENGHICPNQAEVLKILDVLGRARPPAKRRRSSAGSIHPVSEAS